MDVIVIRLEMNARFAEGGREPLQVGSWLESGNIFFLVVKHVVKENTRDRAVFVTS